MFRLQSIAHALSGINVSPHSESKWSGIGFVCSSDSKPQKYQLGNAITPGP